MTPQAKPDSRLHYLDGLRALAALWVVCNHVWLTIYLDPARPIPHGILAALTDWMALGHFAVVAFIVLSGYSLAIGPIKNGYRLKGGSATFLRRRARRILIPYWGALLLSVILALTVLRHRTGTHWDRAIPVSGRGVLAHLLLLQDVRYPAQINHAMWSIAIEWHIYFLFPLLLLLCRRIGLVGATAAFVVAGVVVSHAFPNDGLLLWSEANLIGAFAMGVAGCEVASRGGRLALGNRHVTPPWALITVALMVLILGVLATRDLARAASGSNLLLEPLVGAGMACLLITLAQPSSARLRAALSIKPLVWIGAFSYSLYLLHAPLVQLVWEYGLKPTGLPVDGGGALGYLLVGSLVLSIAVAWLYFLAVERHCMPREMRTAVERELASPVGSPESVPVAP